VKGKMAISELAEAATGRICRVMGGDVLPVLAIRVLVRGRAGARFCVRRGGLPMTSSLQDHGWLPVKDSAWITDKGVPCG
jgi:hypothetical protein